MVGILVNFLVYFLAAVSFWRIQTQRTVDELAKFAMASAQIILIDLISERVITRSSISEFYSRSIPFYAPLARENSLYKVVDVRSFTNDNAPAVMYSSRVTNDIPPDLLAQRGASFLRFGIDKKLYLTTTYNRMTYYYSTFDERQIPGTYALTYEVNFKAILELLKSASMTFALMEFDKDFNYEVIYSDLLEEDTKLLVKETNYIDDDVFNEFNRTSAFQNGYQNAKITTLSSTKHLLYPMSISENTGIRQLLFFIMPLPDYRPIDMDSAFLFLMATFIAALGCFILGLLKIL